jgi:GT2 family glycosyltransferase
MQNPAKTAADPAAGDADQPVVSVIIVNWNGRDYLLQCLASLTPEVCRYPMEIIVVDNASSDGSPEAVEVQFPHVRLIRSGANLGFAKGNNLGIAQSRGRYLALINSDIKVLKNCLSRLVEYCDGHLDAGMVGPRVIGGDGKLQRTVRGFPGLWNMFCRAIALDVTLSACKVFSSYSLAHWSQEDLRTVDILGGCFWVVRREALKDVGLLDESFFMYGEDMDWCRRFWAAGWKLVYVPMAETIHYGGGSSANAPVRFFIEKQRADLLYWKKHHSWPAVAGYFLISCLHLTLRSLGYTFALLCSPQKRQTYSHKVRRSLACLRWMISGRFPGQPGLADSAK